MDWKNYWNRQSTPLHRSDSERFYEVHALELKALFSGTNPSTVLEIGCGDGALYRHLGFDAVTYKGVDYSDSMLSEFRRKFPEVDVECRDGSKYRDDAKYDLIVSNGVIQYFPPGDLARHFGNARVMMHDDSILVCGSIPHQRLRQSFYAGYLAPPYEFSASRHARCLARKLLLRSDTMGHWYSPRDIVSFAARHGLEAELFGSACYLYRFHAVLRPQRGPHGPALRIRRDRGLAAAN